MLYNFFEIKHYTSAGQLERMERAWENLRTESQVNNEEFVRSKRTKKDHVHTYNGD